MVFRRLAAFLALSVVSCVLAAALLLLTSDRDATSPRRSETPPGSLRAFAPPEGPPLSIAFTRPMVEPGAIGTPAPLHADTPGRASWIGVNRAVFLPDVPFAELDTVTVRVETATALDGTRLAEPFERTHEPPTLHIWWDLPSVTGRRPRLSPSFACSVDAAEVAEHAIFASGAGIVPAVATRRPDCPDDAGRRPARLAALAIHIAFPGNPATLLGACALAATPAGDPSPATPRLVDRIEPAADLAPGRVWDFILFPGLRAKDGSRLVAPWRHRFNVVPAFMLEDAEGGVSTKADNAITLRFSSAVNTASLRRGIRIVPETPFTVRAGSNFAHLSGSFAPGRTYWITVGDNVRDRLGTRAEPRTLSVVMPAYSADLAFVDDGQFLDRHGLVALRLRTANVPRADLTIRRLPPDPWIPAAGDRSDVVAESRLSANPVPDEIFTHGISLPGPGRWLVQASAPEVGRSTEASCTVTDLGLSLKLGRSSSIAIATSLRTGLPLSGVRITLNARNGGTLCHATTGPDGLATLPGWHGFTEAPRWLCGRLDDDNAHLDLLLHELRTWNLPVARRMTSGRDDRAVHLHTDRPIYRAGETVHLKGWFRRPPPGLSARLLWLDWRGDEIAAEDVAVSPEGGFHGHVVLPVAASPGSWSARVEFVGTAGESGAASLDFEVGAYSPPAFAVSLEGPERPVFAGETLAVMVRAATFFGTPLADRPVAWWMSLDEATDYRRGEGRTGPDGRLQVLIPLSDRRPPSDDAGIRCYRGSPASLHFEATITDEAGRSISAGDMIPIHGADLVLGVTPARYVSQAGEPIPVEVTANRSDGSPFAGPVHAQLIRRARSSILETVNGGWRRATGSTRENVVAEAPVEAGRVVFAPREAGLHVIRILGQDAEGRQAVAESLVHVTGRPADSWFGAVGSDLAVIPDRSSWRPGETARLLVLGARRGGRLLLTVERDGVESARWIDAAADDLVIEIPIATDMAPNIFAGLLYIPAPGAGDPGGEPRAVRYGCVELEVQAPAAAIPTAVDAPENCRPGDEVTVTVRTEPDAEVTLGVVDAAILALLDHPPADPAAFFARPRPLAVRSFDTHADVIEPAPMNFAGKKGRPGGGGGGPALRRDFRGTAHWQPLLRAGADGVVRATFRLPDNLTTWRIEATAVRAGRFGTATRKLVVKKPFMVTPALPRFARAGDAFEGRFLLHNRSGGAGLARITGADATRDLPLEDRSVTPVDVPFSAGGDQRRIAAALSVTLGEHQDGLEVTMPVHAPTPVESAVLSGEIRGRGTVEPPSFSPILDMRLTLGVTGAVELDGELRRLLEYPWGCVEQTASKTLPLIALCELEVEGADRLIEVGVQRILSMQTGDGGLAYWPGLHESNRHGTLAGAHALALAGRQGFHVPGAAMARLLGYIENLVRFGEGPTRTYALYVLALSGRAGVSWLESLPPDPLLALSALEMNEPTRARALLAATRIAPRIAPEGDFLAPARLRAVDLMAQARLGLPLDTDPADLLRRALLTYERCWSLLALGTVIRAHEAPAGAATHARVRAADGTVTDVDVTRLARLDLPPGPVTIEADGIVRWSLRVRGHGAGGPPEDRGLWVRQFFRPPGGGPPVDSFRAGDLVEGTVIVACTAARAYVAVEAPLPAGLEPVNLRFRTESSAIADKTDRRWHIERFDDRIFASVTYLPPGVHEFSFLARATTPGSYAAPAPFAVEMYAPDVAGRGGSGRIVIRR